MPRWWPALWCLLCCSVVAQQLFTVRLPDGSSVRLPLRAIGGYSAVGLRDLAAVWHGDAHHSFQGELRTPHGRLRTAPLSFFLQWSTAADSGIEQLPVPAQSDGAQLYVPVISLAPALAALWRARAHWVSPTELRLERTATPRLEFPTPRREPPRRIAPLPIPPDSASIPPAPRLPLHHHRRPDSTARTGMLLAAIGNSFRQAPVEIVRIDLRADHDTFQLCFTANGTIVQYQRPEWNQRELIFRIPDVLNAAAPVSHPAVERFHVQRIRDIVVYRIRFAAPIRQCTWRRDGPRTVCLTVLLAGSPLEIARWNLDVIVIDPGHGGEDYGAIGVRGSLEKDITLAVALKLRRLLQRMLPGVRVVLTREDDRFVPLYRRGQLANEARGKLFISLHCNAAPTKPHPARGVETYVLRPGRTAEAIRVAERENAVIALEADPQRYRGLLDEQHILATLAQTAFQRLSDRLAALIQQELVAATGLPDRGVQQAGFYVLVGASMPAVLVEMGFLSNPTEERFLASAAGQLTIARGIAEAIRKYAAEYASLLH